MTTLRVIKNVLSGSADYLIPAYATTGAGGSGLVGGDALDMVFDHDSVLENIIVSALSNGLNINVRLFLLYPTGNTQELTLAGTENVTLTTPFQLNDDSSSRNMSFQIPKWTVLRLFLDSVQIAPAGDGAFQLVVIAQG